MELSGKPLNQTLFVSTHDLLVLHGKQLQSTHLYGGELCLLTCSSVGIICFAVEPKTQNIFILLGREAGIDPRSPRGAWCSFAGHPDPGETAEETGAREFTEESLACVKIPNIASRDLLTYQDAVLSMLTRREYTCKIQTITKTKDHKHARIYFLKEVLWQPALGTEFGLMRSKLLSLKESQTSDEAPLCVRKHPAVSLANGRIFVNTHYLEKQSVEWWSLDRLGDVARNRGRYKEQRFRKSFIPVLKTIFDKFKTCYA